MRRPGSWTQSAHSDKAGTKARTLTVGPADGAADPAHIVGVLDGNGHHRAQVKRHAGRALIPRAKAPPGAVDDGAAEQGFVAGDRAVSFASVASAGGWSPKHTAEPLEVTPQPPACPFSFMNTSVKKAPDACACCAMVVKLDPWKPLAGGDARGGGAGPHPCEFTQRKRRQAVGAAGEAPGVPLAGSLPAHQQVILPSVARAQVS